MPNFSILKFWFFGSFVGNTHHHVATKIKKGDVMGISLNTGLVFFIHNEENIRFTHHAGINLSTHYDIFSKKLGEKIDPDAIADLVAHTLGYDCKKIGEDASEVKYKFF